MKIAVVTQATGEYFVGAEVLFYSIKKHNPNIFADFIYTTEKSITSNLMQKLCAKNVVIPSSEYENIPLNNVYFKETGKKLFALSFTEYDRVIMIDSDMLCIGDISYLFCEHLNNENIWAVRDTAPYYLKKQRELGLDTNLTFNAGTVVFNKPVLGLDIVKMIHDGNLFSYDGGDQGYLNYYCQKFNKSFGFIPNGYNYVLDQTMPQLPKEQRFVVHFTGQNANPWNYRGINKNDFRLEYFELWKKTNEECHVQTN